MIEYSKRNMRVWSMLGSRRVIGVAASEMADIDSKFVLMTADVSRYYAVNKLHEKHPEKIINTGIAEQNLIGVAAAYANEGFNVMAATYTVFATSRALDQIRVNMGYMKLPITLIGVSAGLSEGIMGPTHMGLEDIANIRSIPNITILSPADCTETMKVLVAARDLNTPVYIRLNGLANDPIVYKEDYDYVMGKAIRLREGKDVAIVATGASVHQALLAASELDKQDISCSVVNMHTIKPLDTDILDDLNKHHSLLVSVEEHFAVGGLGSAIAGYTAIKKSRIPHLIIGVQDKFPNADTYENLLEACGLTGTQIAERIKGKYMELSK